jgi:hypothetical protein
LLAPGLFAALLLSGRLPAEEQVSVRFVSFPKAENPVPVRLLVGEGETMAIDIPTNRLSPIYSVEKQAEWVIGETITEDGGGTSFRILGKAASTGSPRQLVFVIRDGKDGFRLVPMEDGGAELGGGTYLFMNLADSEISGKLGDETFVTQPGEHVVVNPLAAAKKDGGIPLDKLPVSLNRAGNPSPFFSSVWRFSSHARSFVFFHAGADGGLRLHTIRDYTK